MFSILVPLVFVERGQYPDQIQFSFVHENLVENGNLHIELSGSHGCYRPPLRLNDGGGGDADVLSSPD